MLANIKGIVNEKGCCKNRDSPWVIERKLSVPLASIIIHLNFSVREGLPHSLTKKAWVFHVWKDLIPATMWHIARRNDKASCYRRVVVPCLSGWCSDFSGKRGEPSEKDPKDVELEVCCWNSNIFWWFYLTITTNYLFEWAHYIIWLH